MTLELAGLVIGIIIAAVLTILKLTKAIPWQTTVIRGVSTCCAIIGVTGWGAILAAHGEPLNAEKLGIAIAASLGMCEIAWRTIFRWIETAVEAKRAPS